MVISVAAREIFVTVDSESDLCVLGRDVLNEFRLTASPKELLLSLQRIQWDAGEPMPEEIGWWANEAELVEKTGAGDKPKAAIIPSAYEATHLATIGLLAFAGLYAAK